MAATFSPSPSPPACLCVIALLQVQWMSFIVWIQEGKNYWKLGLQELQVGALEALAVAVLEQKPQQIMKVLITVLEAWDL